jgi:phage terminase large subunit
MQKSPPPSNDDGALAAVIHDPVRFCRGLLRQDLWPVQEAILRSVATRPRTAVKACHASGQTFCAAAAVLWFVSRYPDGVVVTTAPSWTQVEKVLWGEIHRAAQSSRIAFPQLNKTELRIGPGNYAIGLSTDEGVRFQGFHGRVLLVVDEAPGVKADIWEAIEGIRAGGDVRVLALGNPTVSSGPFYDAFTTNRAGWSTFTISAFDSPNLAGLSLDAMLALPDDERDRNVRPYLVTRRWVKEKFHEWGVGHPLWEGRVCGQFPAQSDDALISLAWLEDAARCPAPDTVAP